MRTGRRLIAAAAVGMAGIGLVIGLAGPSSADTGWGASTIAPSDTGWGFDAVSPDSAQDSTQP